MGIPHVFAARQPRLTPPRGLRNRPRRRATASANLALLTAVWTLACGPARQPEDQHLGSSLDVGDAPDGTSTDGTSSDGTSADSTSAPESPSADDAVQKAVASTESGDEPALISLTELAEKERLEREVARATEALSHVPAPDNDLGIVMSLSQRASDLLWLLAIENRGEAAVDLAAVPTILTFAVTAPNPALSPEPPTPNRGKAAEPKRVICGATPSSVAAGDRVVLEPGQMLTYEFDPRSYCDDDDVLIADATVEPLYGFPLLTRKVWKKGGFVEELQKQKAPFVAQLQSTETNAESPATSSPSSTSATTETPARESTLKQLTAASFVLDETYPLDAISYLPEGALDAESNQSEGETDEDAVPREPLALTIRDMGVTSDPDVRDVTVSVRNTSGHALRLFWRREHLTFEVHSDTEETTCSLVPSDRAPDQAAYAYLSPGSSRSYVTRLREACPKGTFDTPGTYYVSVRLDANSSGSEFGYDAFVGTVQSKTPAKFIVRGDSTRTPPAMRVITNRQE